MNITLSAPPTVIREVREWAEENGTSLNDYIRDCLGMKAAEIKAQRLTQAQAFYEYAMTHSIPMQKGFKWSRAEASERKIKCLS